MDILKRLMLAMLLSACSESAIAQEALQPGRGEAKADLAAAMPPPGCVGHDAAIPDALRAGSVGHSK